MPELNLSESEVHALLDKLTAVNTEIGKAIVGQKAVVDELLISLLAGGHCILEGVPGLAKTLMVSTLANALQLDFRRVQFTPDLMPSDLIGTEILEEDHGTGKRFFKFQKGPVFTNLLLADEINRTPPKTQAALLEVMQERAVSYAGEHYPLDKPFFVLATQNPVEQAGTYALPEAQLDRFLLFIRVAYPSQEEEVEILRRTTSASGDPVQPVLDANDIVTLQSIVRGVAISDTLLDYSARIVRATRPGEGGPSPVQDYVRWGAGPRAGQALVLCAKAHAVLNRRFAVTADDLHSIAPAALRHRLLLNFQAEADGVSTDDIVAQVLEAMPPPTSELL
ncbi:MAG: MoxR family ATPase [Halieaceae bacterium]|nr:MoxR family ATPase [Halieaceae bacterium]